MNVGAPRTLAHSWLLLIHQLPAKPAYLRVKIWRRLQDLGAIAVKNAVHALPMNEETQEDFEWLLREIQEGGGEAFLCEARLIDGLSDEEVRTLFDRARDADYEEVTKTARALAKSLLVSSTNGGSSRNTWSWSVRNASPSTPQRIRLLALPNTPGIGNGVPFGVNVARSNT